MNTHRVRGDLFDSNGKSVRRTAVQLCTRPAAAFALAVFAISSVAAEPVSVEALAADEQPALHVQIAVETTVGMAEPIGVATVAAEIRSLRTERPLSTTEAAAEIAGTEASAPEIRWKRPVHAVADIETIAPDTEARQVLAPILPSHPRSLLELADARSNGTPSPAQRLRLSAKARAKEETCLAKAIYHESRGETLRGQIAVAQVVINRVFTRFYPDTVCGVVYQNAHRRNACQFSFACDGKRRVEKDRRAWAVAQYVAALAVDGKVWEPDIGKATHYHATWVDPWWVGTMHKMASHGVHIFYRPVRWGDGSDEPNWSKVARTTLAALN